MTAGGQALLQSVREGREKGVGTESQDGAADTPPLGAEQAASSRRGEPLGAEQAAGGRWAKGRLRTDWMLEFLLRGLDSKGLPRHPVTLTGFVET